MVLSRKWVWLLRIGCVLLSALILWRLSCLVRPSVVVQTWKSMRVGWFVASVLLYGFLLIPVTVRWHMVLKLSKCAITPVVTYRYTVIGHLFYVLLFGWIGGDASKAVLYSRRQRIPVSTVLATVPFDRFMGTCSSLIIGAAILCAGLPRLDWHVSWVLLVCAAAAILVSIFLLRAKHFKPFDKFFASLRHLGRMMLVHPYVIVLGICCGLACQISLSAVLALNLVSVSTEPVPLGRMIWTFPAVVAISALPITVGGLGAREAAAVFLFGLYGVSSAEAISASLLSFCASLAWALVGALLLMRWKHRFGFPVHRTSPIMPAGSDGQRIL